MKFEANLNGKHIVVDAISSPFDKEPLDNKTWPEILDIVVWPVLRAAGYIIEMDFTDPETLGELHREFLADNK